MKSCSKKNIDSDAKIMKKELLEYLQSEKEDIYNSNEIPREGKAVGLLSINTIACFINSMDTY